MGGDKVKVKTYRVNESGIPENNILVVKGSVPGQLKVHI
jgi:ribosomal protein L3